MKRLLSFLSVMLVAVSMSAAITNMTCAEARTAALALTANNTPAEDSVAVTGYVTNVVSAISKGQQTFWIDDNPGTTKTFEAYWCNIPGASGSTGDPVELGDKVMIKGRLMKYNTTPEIKNGDVVILERANQTFDTLDVTVCEAIEEGGSLATGGSTLDFFRVYGVVSSVTASTESTKKTTFWMDCTEESRFEVYSSVVQGDTMPAVGDSVVVLGRLAEYNGHIEISNGLVWLLAQYVEPEPADTIVLGFQKPADWENVYLYSWTDGTNTGEWPGVQVTPDANGWCYQTYVLNGIDYIWNAGMGQAQTVDLYSEASVCQALSGEQDLYNHYEVTALACGTPLPVDPPTPSEGITVRLFPSAVVESWESVYVYAWNADGNMLGGWPGAEAALVDGWYSYTLPESASPVNIVWNNGVTGVGGEQTGDLTNITSDLCYALGQKVGSQWYCMAIECNTGTSEVTCAAIAAMPDESICKVNELALVWAKYSTYHNATYFFAQDATGSLTIEVNGQNVASMLDAGDRVNGLFGYKSDYKFMPYVGFEDMTVSHGTAPEIPVMSEQPTEADVNKVFRLEGVDMGSYEFLSAPSNYGVMLTDEIYLDLRNAWGDAYVFEAGKTYDMIGYLKGFDEYNYPQVWVSAFAEHEGGVTPVEPEDNIVLRVSQASVDSAGWENVYLFAWNDLTQQPLLGNWPGTPATLVDGWYEGTIAANLAPFSIIWGNGQNGGGLNQTEDIHGVTQSTCYSVRQMSEYDKYFGLVVDCDKPDTVPAIDESPKTIYFWNNITRVYYDSIQVPYGSDYVLTTPTLEYEGYHFVGWEGFWEMEVPTLYNITSDRYVQAKYYINLPEAYNNPITVRVDPTSVPEGWNHLYIYSWTNGAMEEGVTWPGVEMQLDADGWYSHTFPAEVYDIDFLLDNGDGNIGNQTVDVDNVNADLCLRIDIPQSDYGFYMVYLTECPELEPVEDPITVRLMYPRIGWENVYLFQWPAQGEIGQWPGVQLTPGEDGWCNYTFAYDTVVSILFNDGVNTGVLTNQSFDIYDLDHSADYILSGYAWNEERNSYMTTVQQVPAETNPADYRTIAFVDNPTQRNALYIKQVLPGSTIDVLPEAPAYVGYVFVRWGYVDASNPESWQVIGTANLGDTILNDALIVPLYNYVTYPVYVLDWDGSLIISGDVYHGDNVNLTPYIPEREGYEFIGWTDDLQNVTSGPRFTIAQYRPIQEGNVFIQYDGLNEEFVGYQKVDLTLPTPPVHEGYEFLGWEVVAGPIAIGNGEPEPTIHIQAVYQETGGTNAPAVEGEKSARKLFRDGTIFIIDTKDNTYTTLGQKVE